MGSYMHFSRDAGLSEQSTQAVWESHDLCPSSSQFQVREMTKLELLALSHAGAWGYIETQAQHGVSSNSARQDHRGREGVQPGSSMDAPTPSMPFLLGWGGIEAHPADWHRHQLGLCLGTTQWRHTAHTPVQQGAYKCNDRWQMQHALF